MKSLPKVLGGLERGPHLNTRKGAAPPTRAGRHREAATSVDLARPEDLGGVAASR
jgi:hypothetical protein